ncbi:MAG TPA: hypothetical protein VFZ40_21290 [Pyrinomonadaceae bacterium]
MNDRRPIIVAVSGLSSNTGKTTLVCELLERLSIGAHASGMPHASGVRTGWEAIKLTRGHYRSCGKDPNGCCVSELLRDEPLIRSGRAGNYEKGKDTGRFWDAGGVNVHWVIVGEDQVEAGINEALSRVQSAGVIVEGNSFLDYVQADYAIMCARAGENKLKTSSKRILAKVDAIYLSTINDSDRESAIQNFDRWRAGLSTELNTDGLEIYTRHDLPRLIGTISSVSSVVHV